SAARSLSSSYLVPARTSLPWTLFSLSAPPPSRISTLSLHDALPISYIVGVRGRPIDAFVLGLFVTLSHTSGIVLVAVLAATRTIDRKSTRLNSSHLGISYAVFCLKKKNTI